MKVKAEFQDGKAFLVVTPEDEWEQKLLGAVARGGETLQASVSYKSEGHFSYGKCAVVKVELSA